MTADVRSGAVSPEGVSWTVSTLHPSEMFWRQLRFQQFDVPEMSLSSLAIAVAKGDRSWIALPVFTTRRFFHLLGTGKLDAALVYIANANLVDRTRVSADESGRVRPLFADPLAEGIRYYEKTGLLPVSHCVVIRAPIAEQHPWLALNIVAAFIRAKEKQAAALAELLGPYRTVGGIPAGVAATVATMDPLPYGVAGQRETLETLMNYLVEQGLTPRRVELAELFAASTADI